MPAWAGRAAWAAVWLDWLRGWLDGLVAGLQVLRMGGNIMRHAGALAGISGAWAVKAELRSSANDTICIEPANLALRRRRHRKKHVLAQFGAVGT